MSADGALVCGILAGLAALRVVLSVAVTVMRRVRMRRLLLADIVDRVADLRANSPTQDQPDGHYSMSSGPFGPVADAGLRPLGAPALATSQREEV